MTIAASASYAAITSVRYTDQGIWLPELVVLTVPIHTISESNAREHWAVKAKRTKLHRVTTSRAVGTVDRVGDFAERGTYAAITLTRNGARKLDDDNLRGSLKAIRDGVTDGMGLKNDSDPRLRWDYAQEVGKGYSVEITMVLRWE